MTADSEKKTFQYREPNLDIPNPPSNLSYAEFADFQNREILNANGIQLSETALVSAVEETTNILQAAAAHTIGTLPSLTVKALSALTKLLSDPNDAVIVEAAYALARHGVPEGTAALVKCLDYSLKACVSPLTAAGYLAQRGNPQGFPIVVKGFDSDLAAVRSVASKQLYFFAPFDGTKDEQGNTIDLVHEFERALEDPDTGIQWQALIQLREVALPAVREFLESYARNTRDQGLQSLAEAILQGLVWTGREKE
jgi:HEAT repeat protein